MSKKYTTNFLEDTNGSTGSANQVLVSTAAGVDWVDGSGSAIIGGPYLPLAGGTMTGSIDFGTNNRDISMKDAAGALTRVMVLNTSNTMYIGPVDTYAGGSILYGTAAGVSYQRFYTGASERMRITPSGDVGIGTTLPSAKLDVAGGTKSGFFTTDGGRGFKQDGVSFVGTYSNGNDANGANDLGSTTNQWRDVYISGDITSSAGGATFAGDITSAGLTVDYTGNRTGDAGILVTNDSSDWGIKVDKDGTTDYGILSQTDGENAIVVRNAAGVNKIQLQGDGDATFTGNLDVNGTGNNTFTGNIIMDNAAPILQTNSSNNASGFRINVTGIADSTNSLLRVQRSGTTMIDTRGNGNTTFTAQAFSAATSSGDASSTLTTKGYVDGLITGATIYRGTWDPDVSLNSGYGNPNLNTVTQTSGYYYICSADGAATPNGTGTEPDSWNTGDWVIWNDDIGTSGEWQKIDNSSVLSGVGTGQTVALWQGASSVTDSETLGNAPITVSGNATYFTGPITAEFATSSAMLNLYNTTNGGGSTIRFSDQTTQTQVGDITFYHADGSSQGGGASWHFASQPDTVLVVGSSTVNGRFVAKSAGSATEVDYGFYDDVNTGMYRAGADTLAFSTAGAERMRIATNGAIGIGGANYGSSGQVLTSNGNAAPSWQTPTTGTVKGTGTATRVAFWSASDTISSSDDLYWDNTIGGLGINDTTPNARLKVTSGTSDTSVYTVDINHVRNDANVATHAMRLNVDLSGADTTTADRTNSGLQIDIDSSANGDSANEHRIYGVNSAVNFSGFSDIVRAGYFVAESNYTGAKTAQLAGVYGYAIHDAGSTNGGVSNMYGVFGLSSIQDLGDVDQAFGGYFQVSISTNRGAADVGITKGVEGEIAIDKDVAINYGDMIGVSSIIDNNEGAVPNFGSQYLFKGDYQGTKGGNAYGIYVEGDKHYFDGNVGIGVTSPGVKLHVESASLGGNINDTTTQAIFEADTASSDKLYIQNYRTVAGTAWTSNGKRIQEQVDSTWMGYIQFNGGETVSSGNGEISFGTGQSTTQSSVAERMRIDSSGNVGIGITDPTNLLHIKKTGFTRGTFEADGDNQVGIQITRSNSSNNTNWEIYSPAASTDLRFFNGGDRLTISSSGAIKFNAYNSTNNTGTPTYLLGTDGSGNVVKTLSTPGGDPGPYLPLVGGTLTGGLIGTSVNMSLGIKANQGMFDNVSGLRLLNPGGGSNNSLGNANTTGAIKITLPQSWTSTMMRMTIKVYEYTTDESFTVVCGGYNYSASSAWINGFAYIESSSKTDRNFTVRLSHDGTKCCVYIGELTSVWQYPKVYVTEFEAGFNSTTASNWQTGWSISMETTAFGTTTYSEANTQINNWARSGNDVYWSSGSGNVGIGVAGPVTKLNVAGNIAVTATKAYRMYNAANTGWGEMSFIEADNRIQFNRGIQNSGVDWRLTENSANSFVCATQGNFGIGTTTPGAKLDVSGYVQMDSYVANESGNNAFNSGYLKIIAGAKTGWGVGDELGKINFFGNDTSGIGARNAASIVAVCEDGNGTSTTTFSSGLAFYTSPYNAAQEERMRIDSSGNVGIGTTNPAQDFVVADATNGNGIELVPGATATIQTYNRGTSSYNNINIDTNSARIRSLDYTAFYNGTFTSESMRIDSAGNVGIGTTSPAAKLHIYSAGSSNVQDILAVLGSDGNRPVLQFSESTAGSITAGMSLEYNGMGSGDTNYMVINSVANVPRFAVMSGGNVGIGTTSPSQRLHVVGNARVTGAYYDSNNSAGTSGQVLSSTASGTDWVDVLTGSGTSGVLPKWNSAGTALIDSGLSFPIGSSYADFVLGAGGTTTVRFIGNASQTGDFSIKNTTGDIRLQANNTTATTAKFTSSDITLGENTFVQGSLRVEGSVQADLYIGNIFGPSDTNTGYRINHSSLGCFIDVRNDVDKITYRDYPNATGTINSKFEMNMSSGNFTATGNIIAFGTISDRKLKENIKPIDSALDKAMRLQGVTFNWKKSDSILEIGEDIGFIAQDVQKVLPELVRENKNGEFSLRHQGITPILLEAIKELKAEIEELKKQIK